MRSIAKSAALLLALLLLTPVLALVAFDVVAFQPRLPEIRGLLSRAAPHELSPPAPLVKVIRLSGLNLGGQVTRLLMQHLGAYPEHGGMTAHHFTSLAWWALVMIHLSEAERITLYLSQSYMGSNTSGYAAAAPLVVGVSLGEVSVEQAAKLVVVAKAPSYYLGHRERLALAAATLASRAKDAP